MQEIALSDQSSIDPSYHMDAHTEQNEINAERRREAACFVRAGACHRVGVQYIFSKKKKHVRNLQESQLLPESVISVWVNETGSECQCCKEFLLNTFNS